MAVRFQIVGNNGNTAKVSKTGELIVAPFEYSDAMFNTLDLVNTAYNFYAPKSQKQFVMTGIVAFADKDINDASDTVIDVYEASTSTSITIDKTLIEFGMAKLSVVNLSSLNIIVNKGKFLNAKTSDDDIHMTIMGYYIPKL